LLFPAAAQVLFFSTDTPFEKAICLHKRSGITMMRAVTLLLAAGAASALTDIDHKPLFRKNMDPIISPGKFVSHMHSFYGSDAITKNLPTTAELQKGCPSGENPNDLSIYCTFGQQPPGSAHYN
jgi:hypothetical protein